MRSGVQRRRWGRQRGELARLLGEGLGYREIAVRLGRGVGAVRVEAHRSGLATPRAAAAPVPSFAGVRFADAVVGRR